MHTELHGVISMTYQGLGAVWANNILILQFFLRESHSKILPFLASGAVVVVPLNSVCTLCNSVSA